jgi:hypothetical protein
MPFGERLRQFAQKPAREKLRIVRRKMAETDWYWKIHSPGADRTTYIIGLFGTGRLYIYELMLRHIGERAKYLTTTIRVHRGPTSMIYSAHATLKYVSREQALPAVTHRILEAVRARFADLIFVYRHPLDSLITNWVFWRTYVRTGTGGAVVAQIYETTDDVCADLEKNFAEFESFAAGDPAFFAGLRGPRFLSFQEFVEETELHLQSASLTLRLEDFTVSPTREFSRIANVMSVDLNLNGSHISPPRTRPYRYLELKAKVPRFRSFIARLDTETQRRIEAFGYSVS